MFCCLWESFSLLVSIQNLGQFNSKVNFTELWIWPRCTGIPLMYTPRPAVRMVQQEWHPWKMPRHMHGVVPNVISCAYHDFLNLFESWRETFGLRLSWCWETSVLPVTVYLGRNCIILNGSKILLFKQTGKVAKFQSSWPASPSIGNLAHLRHLRPTAHLLASWSSWISMAWGVEPFRVEMDEQISQVHGCQWKNHCITLGHLVWTDGLGTPSSPLHSNHPNKTAKSWSFGLKQVPCDTNKTCSPSGLIHVELLSASSLRKRCESRTSRCLQMGHTKASMIANQEVVLQGRGSRLDVKVNSGKVNKTPLQGNNEETRSAALVWSIPNPKITWKPKSSMK